MPGVRDQRHQKNDYSDHRQHRLQRLDRRGAGVLLDVRQFLRRQVSLDLGKLDQVLRLQRDGECLESDAVGLAR